jgi:hypothetical protein
VSALDEVLGRLKNVRREGEGYKVSCPCPSHGRGRGDQNPSLSVGVDPQGKVLLKCFAGCENEDVVPTLGLWMSDLFEPRESRDSTKRNGAK